MMNRTRPDPIVVRKLAHQRRIHKVSARGLLRGRLRAASLHPLFGLVHVILMTVLRVAPECIWYRAA